MSMVFNAFANRMKDAALQGLAKWFANRYHLKRFGRIADLKLDSVAEEIFVILDLHGEVSPIELTVRYRVVSPTLLEIGDVKASRQWIEELINQVMTPEQKSVTVSSAVTRALSKVMK
jgi:hypothetical protein